MSVFTEFRPLFQFLDEPFLYSSPRSHQNLDTTSTIRQPAVHIAEDGDHYVVEAEVPGVKKENLALTVGSDGKSLLIEGKAEERNPRVTSQIKGDEDTNATSPSKESSEATKATRSNEVGHPTWNGERFLRNMTFSKTVRLPHAVDGDSVAAKLEHGILRVEMKKKDQGRMKVTIN